MTLPQPQATVRSTAASLDRTPDSRLRCWTRQPATATNGFDWKPYRAWRKPVVRSCTGREPCRRDAPQLEHGGEILCPRDRPRSTGIHQKCRSYFNQHRGSMQMRNSKKSRVHWPACPHAARFVRRADGAHVEVARSQHCGSTFLQSRHLSRCPYEPVNGCRRTGPPAWPGPASGVGSRGGRGERRGQYRPSFPPGRDNRRPRPAARNPSHGRLLPGLRRP